MRYRGWHGRSVIAARLARLITYCNKRTKLPRLVDLAAEFEVHPRTIRRDLQAIRDAFITVPPFREKGEGIA